MIEQVLLSDANAFFAKLNPKGYVFSTENQDESWDGVPEITTIYRDVLVDPVSESVIFKSGDQGLVIKHVEKFEVQFGPEFPDETVTVYHKDKNKVRKTTFSLNRHYSGKF